MGRATVEHSAAADLVPRTESQPGAKRFGATPPAHVQSNLRKDDQHTQYVQADDLCQIDSANPLQLLAQILLHAGSGLAMMKALLLGLVWFFGFRIFWNRPLRLDALRDHHRCQCPL